MKTVKVDGIGITPELLQAVDKYYKQKLKKGEFDVVKEDPHSVIACVDGRFHFEIWTANEDYALRVYRQITYSDFVLNKAERLAIWNKLKDRQEETLKAYRLKQYEELKSEFETN